jgi:hypothetical protein
LVLATELSHDQQHYVAHNKFYEQVYIIALFLRVKIKGRKERERVREGREVQFFKDSELLLAMTFKI